jgi:hypothetical protein
MCLLFTDMVIGHRIIKSSKQHGRQLYCFAQMLLINDTGSKFVTNTASVVDIGGKFATCVNVTGSKFAAGVVDTGGK